MSAADRNANASKSDASPEWGPKSAHTLLNHDLPRVDGPDKVTGRARYTHDVRLPGMLYARLLLCPLPAAKVTLDVSPAKKIAGVVEARVIQDGETRFLGQPVAVVAAKTPELAEDGIRAIAMKLEPLPWAVTREQSLAKDAPKVTKRGNVREGNDRGDSKDAESALGKADATVEATYSVPVQHHACLETHGAVVDYKGGDDATVYSSTQSCFDSAGEFQEVLKAKGQVDVVTEHMGGGFGAKFGGGTEGRIAAELARDLKTPVHLMLTRKDEFLMAGNRSGCVQTLKAGASKDGKLVALRAAVDRLGGLGDGSHAGQPYIYKVATAHGSMRSVYTHTDSSRAMRAPGHPQASFGIESIIDELAYKLGLDLVAFRKANVDGETYQRQLDRAAKEIGWLEHRFRTAPDLSDAVEKVGIGFALSRWGGGGGPSCVVTVEIRPDGSVSAKVGSQDLGTATRTYVAAIVAEEFGLKLSDVVARIGHSSYGSACGSGGSVTTASLAPAVKNAAFAARSAFAESLAKTLRCEARDVAFSAGTVVDGKSKKTLAWKEACATLPPAGISQTGEWSKELASNGVHGVQAAKVKVDTRTGRVQILKMVGVQDCGLPLNRLAIRSQLNGGMIQGLSYALFEERVIDPELGLPLNANLEDYKLAGCQEIPEMLAIIDDDDTRAVIGMAEPAIVPGHSAVANAVHNACGVRIRDLPLTADKVLMGLQALKKG